MSLFRSFRKPIVRYYYRIIKRSWLRSYWMVRRAVRAGIGLADVLNALSAVYKKILPQTLYLKLINDIQVGKSGEIKRNIKAIFFPEWASNLFSLSKTGEGKIYDPLWFSQVNTVISGANPVRGQVMAEEMSNAVECKRDCLEQLTYLNGTLSSFINESDKASDVGFHRSMEKIKQWFRKFTWRQFLRYCAVIGMSGAESLLTYLGFSNSIDIKSINLSGFPQFCKKLVIPSLSVAATAAMVFTSHFIIKQVAFIYNNPTSRDQKIARIFLVVVLFTIQVTISAGITALRIESFIDPLQGSEALSSGNFWGDGVQFLLVFLLPFVIGYLTYNVSGRSIEIVHFRKDNTGIELTDTPVFHHSEIMTIKKSIKRLEKTSQQAQKKIGSIYAKAEKELETITSIITMEEKLLLTYLDEHYAALMLDRFLYLTMVMKKGNGEEKRTFGGR